MTGTPTKYEGIVKLGPNKYNIRVRATCPRSGMRKGVERVRECSLLEAHALQLQWQTELKESFLSGGSNAPRQRLKDFVPSWLSGRIAEGELKPSSADKIALVWDLHIAPTRLAQLYTDDIHEGDVLAWIDDLRAKRYAPGKGKATKRKGSKDWAYSKATIRGYFRVLRTILVAAGAGGSCANIRGKGKLKLAPLGDVTKRHQPKRGNFLSRDELTAVLGHVEQHAPQWYVAVLLDVFVGLRWGELSALRWSDIDEQQQVIRVERGNYEGKVVNSTKTGDEDDPHAKLVPLLPEVKALLEERRVQMIAKQHKGLKEGWIFPTTEGTLYKGSPLRSVIDDALTACNIDRRVTPHGLRHTANNELRKVANGEVVRSIIGHATEAMTHHYSHVDENEKRAAVARVFSIVKGAAVADRGADRSGSEDRSEAEVPEMLGGATQI